MRGRAPLLVARACMGMARSHGEDGNRTAGTAMRELRPGRMAESLWPFWDAPALRAPAAACVCRGVTMLCARGVGVARRARMPHRPHRKAPGPSCCAQMDTIIGAVPKATLVQTIEKYL